MLIAKRFSAVLAMLVLLVSAAAFWLPQDALAAEQLTAGGTAPLTTQSSGKDLIFDGIGRFNCKAAVLGVTSGSATYDKATSTLTLTNVRAKTIQIGAQYVTAPVTTVKLVGNNVVTSGVDSIARGLKIVGPGSLDITQASYGIRCIDSCILDNQHSQTVFTLSSGTVNIASPSKFGVFINSGNFVMTGGNLSITNSSGSSVGAYSDSHGGKTYGGKVTITGGAVKITNKSANKYAIYSNSITNKATCLKTIKGRLPEGSRFNAGGSEYLITDKYRRVKLVSYGASSTKPTINNVTYGDNSYRITSMASKAFNTNAGKKVKTLSMSNIRAIPANAFYGADALTSVKLGGHVDSIASKAFNGANALKTVSVSSVDSLASNAFYGAKALKTITIKNVESLASKAFGGARVLKTVVIGHVIKMDDKAFYGAKARTVSIKYADSIAPKAFYGATALKTLKIGYAYKVGANAFYGTKSLTKLDIQLNLRYKHSYFGKLKSITLLRVSKKAFAKAGKSSGAKLTVVLNGGVPKSRVSVYKKYLAKYGLSKKAALKVQ